MKLQKRKSLSKSQLSAVYKGERFEKLSILSREHYLRSTFLKDSRHLRTFARKFSNIDFFLQILPLKDDELVMSEMLKEMGSNRLRFGENLPGRTP